LYRLPEQLLNTIRDRTDLVSVVGAYVRLKKAGQNHMGLCPFHVEKTPSFTVSPAKQIFHCFGCGIGGNVFSFLMKMNGTAFVDTAEQLARKSGVVLPERTKEREKEETSDNVIYEINDKAALYFHQILIDGSQSGVARDYLKKRGIQREVIERFHIGYAPSTRSNLSLNFSKQYAPSLLEKAGLVLRKEESKNHLFDRFYNRIMVPIADWQGRVVGFGGRALDNMLPKYLNTPETTVFVKGRQLFGIDQLSRRHAIHQAPTVQNNPEVSSDRGRETLIVVEGYFDALSLYQAGVENVVATMGTALTEDHLRMIRRLDKQVVLLFDPDPAGLRAAFRAAPMILESGIAAKIVSLPAGEDPDLFIRNHGKERFYDTLRGGRSPIDFCIERSGWAGGGTTLQMKVLNEWFSLVSRLTNKVEQGYYLKIIAETIGAKEQDVRSDFAKLYKMGAKPSISSSQKLHDKVVSVQKPLPRDEEQLVSLLVQDHLSRTFRDQLSLEDLTDSGLREIASLFWNACDARTGVREALLPLFTRLSLLDHHSENTEKIAEDCIVSIKTNRLRKEAAAVQGQLKQAEKGGDLDSVRTLEDKFFHLRKNLHQLQKTAHNVGHTVNH